MFPSNMLKENKTRFLPHRRSMLFSYFWYSNSTPVSEFFGASPQKKKESKHIEKEHG